MIVEVRGEEVALNAATCFQRAVELNPRTHIKAINNMGMIHHQQNDLEAAEAMYRRAVEAAPSYATGWYNLGLVAMNRRKAGLNATECFLNAIEVRPHITHRPLPSHTQLLDTHRPPYTDRLHNAHHPPLATRHPPTYFWYGTIYHPPLRATHHPPHPSPRSRTPEVDPRPRLTRTSSWRACSSKSRSSSSPLRRPHASKPSERYTGHRSELYMILFPL